MKPTTKQSWYNITAANNEATVYVYDEIGGWGIAAKDFATELNALQNIGQIHLRVNSPGGSVVDVLAMMKALETHPAKVTAYVDGLAASSASRLILAADEVEMASNAFVMIHNVWSLAIGNATELRKEADILDKFDKGLANDYAKKTGKDLEEINALMAEDTWFDADEALEFGIVDRIGAEQKAAACVSSHFMDTLKRFKNLPEDLPVKEKTASAIVAAPAEDEPDEEPQDNLIDLTYAENAKAMRELVEAESRKTV